MRKKTMAILMASAVAVAGIIGLTACSDNAKGEKVTEEQWKAAITATANAGNYTATFNQEGKDTASGKVEDKTVNYVGTETTTGHLYYDLTSKKVLMERKSIQKITGGELIGEEDGEETGERKSYYEADGLTIWYAALYEDETEWYVYSRTTTENGFNEDFASSGLAYSLANSEFSTTADGEAVKISELYSAFTYKNGKYSATLYDDGDKIDISVSIKGGYIINVTSETTTEFTDEDDGITFKTTYKMSYDFGDFGKTTVTTPEDAATAIANKKTPKN